MKLFERKYDYLISFFFKKEGGLMGYGHKSININKKISNENLQDVIDFVTNEEDLAEMIILNMNFLGKHKPSL